MVWLVLETLVAFLGVAGFCAAIAYAYFSKTTKDAIANAAGGRGAYADIGFEVYIGRLRDNQFVHWYQGQLRALLDGLAELIRDNRKDAPPPADGAWSPPPFLTTASYFFVFSLAILYPILMLFGGWMAGSQGELGGLPVLPENPDWWLRLMSIGATLFVGLLLVLIFLTTGIWRAFLALTAGALTGAFAVTFAFGLGGAGAFAVAVATAVVCAGVVAGAVGGTGAGAGAFAGAVAVAIAGAFAYVVVITVAGAGALIFVFVFIFVGVVAFAVGQRYRISIVWGWLAAFGLPILLLLLFYWDGASPFITITVDIPPTERQPPEWPDWIGSHNDVPEGNKNLGAAVQIIFLALLPAVNAFWDWISLGVSRYLLNGLAKGDYGWFHGLLLAFADLVAALFFLLIMAVTATGALALAERLHVLGRAEPVIDVSQILAGIRDNPWSADHVWIYAMLLTTLVPTAVHFLAAVGAAATAGFAQTSRMRVIEWMERARDGDALATQHAHRGYGLIMAGGVFIAVGSLQALTWIIWYYGGAVWLFGLRLCEIVAGAIKAWDGSPLV